jgi:PAS domain-containing protein
MLEYHRIRRKEPATAPRKYEFRFTDRHGAIKDIDLSVDMIPGTKQTVASLHDITDHKRAEEAIKKSEERYRLLVENINLGITLIGTDYRIIMTNTSQGKFFNRPAGAFTGRHCFREFEKRNEVCPHCPGKIAMATGRMAEIEANVTR